MTFIRGRIQDGNDDDEEPKPIHIIYLDYWAGERALGFAKNITYLLKILQSKVASA